MNQTSTSLGRSLSIPSIPSILNDMFFHGQLLQPYLKIFIAFGTRNKTSRSP